MKRLLILITLLFASIVNGQSLKDLISFKTMGLNKIEEHLTLEGWSFKSSESSKGLAEKNDTSDRVYKSRTYTYKGDLTSLTITDFKDSDINEIKILSQSKRIYNNILEDLVDANFRSTNEKSSYIKHYLGNFNIEKKINLESEGKIYRKGDQEVHLIIYKRAIVVDKYNEKFSYDQNVITNQYLIIVK